MLSRCRGAKGGPKALPAGCVFNISRFDRSCPSTGLRSTDLLGLFMASADDTIITAAYGSISSEFHALEMGSWLLTGYNFGYCVTLPIVSRPAPYQRCINQNNGVVWYAL